MSRDKDNRRNTKKKPLRTKKEKRQAKREKRDDQATTDVFKK